MPFFLLGNVIVLCMHPCFFCDRLHSFAEKKAKTFDIINNKHSVGKSLIDHQYIKKNMAKGEPPLLHALGLIKCLYAGGVVVKVFSVNSKKSTVLCIHMTQIM